MQGPERRRNVINLLGMLRVRERLRCHSWCWGKVSSGDGGFGCWRHDSEKVGQAVELSITSLERNLFNFLFDVEIWGGFEQLYLKYSLYAIKFTHCKCIVP